MHSHVAHDVLPWAILLILPVVLGVALYLFADDEPHNAEPDPEPQPERAQEEHGGDSKALAA